MISEKPVLDFDCLELGQMYKFFEFTFLLFPTKEILLKVYGGGGQERRCAETVKKDAENISSAYCCDVDTVRPREAFMLAKIDKENRLIKILSSDKIGWIDLRYLKSVTSMRKLEE